jgi:hypothetical protein
MNCNNDCGSCDLGAALDNGCPVAEAKIDEEQSEDTEHLSGEYFFYASHDIDTYNILTEYFWCGLDWSFVENLLIKRRYAKWIINDMHEYVDWMGKDWFKERNSI